MEHLKLTFDHRAKNNRELHRTTVEDMPNGAIEFRTVAEHANGTSIRSVTLGYGDLIISTIAPLTILSYVPDSDAISYKMGMTFSGHVMDRALATRIRKGYETIARDGVLDKDGALFIDQMIEEVLRSTAMEQVNNAPTHQRHGR